MAESKRKRKPRREEGPWIAGITLDHHTESSELTGYDEHTDEPQFKTIHTALGEAVHRLKYWGHKQYAEPIGKLVAKAVDRRWPNLIDVVVSAPFSKKDRSFQPVLEIAAAVSQELACPHLADFVRKRSSQSMKSLASTREKLAALKGQLTLRDPQKIRGKTVLLLDDLFDSGTTARFVTQLLLDAGAEGVYFIAVTRTGKE